jgi:hypothetical protein
MDPAELLPAALSRVGRPVPTSRNSPGFWTRRRWPFSLDSGGMSSVSGLSDGEVLCLIEALDAESVSATGAGRFFRDGKADNLAEAFREAAMRGLRVSEGTLVRWIGVTTPKYRLRIALETITAARFNPAPPVLSAVRATLVGGDASSCTRAISTLGCVRDHDSIAPIAGLLPVLAEQDEKSAFGHGTVALEKIGDSSVAVQLQSMIPTAPDWGVYWLTRAIRRLTRHSVPPPPLSNWETDPKSYMAALRDSWWRIDLSGPPAPCATWRVVSGSRAEAAVRDGRDVFSLEPDDTGSSSWPEWEFSWRHGGERLYEVGSVCPTCEVLLSRVGWSPARAVELAQTVRAEVADVRGLDDALLMAVEPLLCALASGHYQIRLIDLSLTSATWADTWYAADAPEPPVGIQASPTPGDVVYQPPFTGEPVPLVIAPTQPAIDPLTVERYEHAILRGERPAAIVAAHAAERQAWDADQPHRSVTGFIIDGHHKLAAYARCGVDARIILICDRTPRLPPGANPLSIFDKLIPEITRSNIG